jgi:uncharacterized protein YjbJ (UPF0337 family)
LIAIKAGMLPHSNVTRVAGFLSRKEHEMSTNRIEGAGKQAVGGAKEAIGKATGDKKLEAQGIVEKTTGTVQNAVGKAQDKLGDAVKK